MLMPKININDNMSEDEMILEFKKSMIDFNIKLYSKIINKININKNIIDIVDHYSELMINDIIKEFKSKKISIKDYLVDINHFNELYDDLYFRKAIRFSERDLQKKYPSISKIINKYNNKVIKDVIKERN